jgi:hypothetical protein
MSSIRLLRRSMHQAIVQELVECIVSESVLRHHGESRTADMIAFFLRRILPYRDLEVYMWRKFAYFFLLTIIAKHTLVRWYNGLRLLVIALARTQECGWWNPNLTAMDSV